MKSGDIVRMEQESAGLNLGTYMRTDFEELARLILPADAHGHGEVFELTWEYDEEEYCEVFEYLLEAVR